MVILADATGRGQEFFSSVFLLRTYSAKGRGILERALSTFASNPWLN